MLYVKILLIVLSIFAINSCCYVGSAIMLEDIPDRERHNRHRYELNMKINLRNHEVKEVMEYTTVWLNHNFKFRPKNENYARNHVYYDGSGDELIKYVNYDYGKIFAVGVSDFVNQRPFECTILIHITETYINFYYHDFVLFENYSGVPYQVTHYCQISKIKRELRKLTNNFAYGKLNRLPRS